MSTVTHPNWELFVFDWDGTLMETTFLIARAIQEACRSLDLRVPDVDTARSSIGLGRAESMQRVCPDCPPEQWDDFTRAYRQWYLHQEALIAIEPRLLGLLRSMRAHGLRLAVATGKSRGGLDRVFEISGTGDLFEATVTADESFSKPNPDMLYRLSDQTGVEVSRMVMIGDATFDLLMARNGGASSVGVTWGAGSLEQLAPLASHGMASTTEELAQRLGVAALLPQS